jgi:hypothetical protein
MTEPAVDPLYELYYRRVTRAPSRGQFRALKYYALHGDHKSAAHAQGISEQTQKNHISMLLKNLDVSTVLEAMKKLGWLNIPGDPAPAMCGAIGICTKPIGHIDDHGQLRLLRGLDDDGDD